MSRKRSFRNKLSIILLVLALITLLLGNDTRCETDRETGEVVISGRLYLIGNEPFTSLAIQTEDGRQVRLTEDDRETFLAYQGQTVTLKGTISTRELTTADGKITVTQYYLMNPEIVE